MTRLVLLLGFVAGPALAKIPSASTVLERTSAWAKALPAHAVAYGLERDGARLGEATLGPDRRWAGGPRELGVPVFGLWAELLSGAGADVLRRHGVDLDVTSLYHLHRRVVVILGAEPMKPGVPQVWIDRETGAVLRIVLKATESGFHTLTLRGPWPMRIEHVGPAGRRLYAEPDPIGGDPHVAPATRADIHDRGTARLLVALPVAAPQVRSTSSLRQPRSTTLAAPTSRLRCNVGGH